MDIFESLSTREKKAIETLTNAGFKVFRSARIEEVVVNDDEKNVPTFQFAGVYDLALVLKKNEPRTANVRARVKIDKPDPVEKQAGDVVVPNNHVKKTRPKK
jgi:hypothetical protein